MTQPVTNAQVALLYAVQVRSGHFGHMDPTAWNADVLFDAGLFLEWLNANTPPAADQPGELG